MDIGEKGRLCCRRKFVSRAKMRNALPVVEDHMEG